MSLSVPPVSPPLWQAIHQLQENLSQTIIGQQGLVQRLIIALLSDGHLLVEGAPGLAKTRAVKALAQSIEGDFHRIQFTPDLLPADVTGTDIYHLQDGSFQFQPGPIFHNLVLADEINRAPAKVQSALLEAMAERQVSIGTRSHLLPSLFMVMATQNPIEQEGTYALPEAQLDRFLMHVKIDYPDFESERKILHLHRQEASHSAPQMAAMPHKITQAQIFAARQEILQLHMTPAVEDYLIQLTLATRHPADYDPALQQAIEYGVSPRGTLALDRCARAKAWLAQRNYVTPEDIQHMLPDIFRHRIGLTFSAQAKGMTRDSVLEELLSRVPAP